VGDAPRPTPADIDARLQSIGDGIAYADGSEAAVVQALMESQDRSSSSDELEGFIRDWPTRYHLSRSRTNLLRALRFRPGTDVIEAPSSSRSNELFRGDRVCMAEGYRNSMRPRAQSMVAIRAGCCAGRTLIARSRLRNIS